MKQSLYGPEAFLQDSGVSRETVDRLKIYADLLQTWNQKINLVSKSTIPDLWQRHIRDSAQLFPLLPPGAQTLLDLGSGAGFPGLVLSILGVPKVHLAESDQRKCAFLREAARVAGATLTVHAKRIEAIAPFPVDVITARALAPVSELLDLAAPFIGENTKLVFLKGQNVEVELTEAHKRWRISARQIASLTDSAGTIVCMDEVRRVEQSSEPARNP